MCVVAYPEVVDIADLRPVQQLLFWTVLLERQSIHLQAKGMKLKWWQYCLGIYLPHEASAFFSVSMRIFGGEREIDNSLSIDTN